MDTSKIPDWVTAAVRYVIALIGTTVGLTNEDTITRAAAAVVTLATIAYGLYRTNTIAKTGGT